ncbi:MAG TPA: universal stress protein [Amycolatopsis sp.]|nr:universal stress protein [Amycolatopsis sp.]
MTTTTRHPVVAGVDGSVWALDAVRWAAREATRRDASLHLFHVCVLPPLGPHVAAGTELRITEALVEQGYGWLREAKAAARDAAGEVEIRTQLRVGAAAGALIAESAQAMMLVLGSHGLGGFAGMLVGSVARGVAAHGRCPVVVVRGDQPPADGPVVVGVDSSTVCDAAIAFAFDEASLRGVPLVAVHTWLDESVGETWSVLPFDIDWDVVAAEERRLLAAKLTGWQEKYPGVEVRQEVVRGRPVPGLLAWAGGAQLIVVGARGRGALTGVGLGSTSQNLLHHSTCPVAVVHPGNGG